MKSFSNRPLIFAHRGASAHAPENTLAAFKLAASLHADGVEFDIKFTKDKEIIIIHDATVERTTTGKGKVKDLTCEEIQRLDIDNSFSEQFHGEKIPRLIDVLNVLPESLLFNIEITNYTTIFDGLASAVAKMVQELGIGERVLFSSFNPFNLISTKRVAPEIPVALLALPGNAGSFNRSRLMRGVAPNYINPYFSDIVDQFVEKQHQNNRKVIAWTVNDVNEIIRLFDQGVDGIITDDPSLVRKVLGIE